MVIIVVGAALGRAQLVAAGMVLVALGTLLLVDLNGGLERLGAVVRIRAVPRRGGR